MFTLNTLHALREDRLKNGREGRPSKIPDFTLIESSRKISIIRG
jgi:hypothetical protein